MIARWLVPLALALFAPLALLAASPLLDGVGRRVRARLESRAGPPLVQGYVDLAKLAGKREVSAASGALARLLPGLALAAALAAGALLPVGGRAPLGFAGDALTLAYLLALSSLSLALAGSASGSAFAFLGAGREALMLLLVEPALLVALFVLGVRAGSFRLDAIVAWQLAHGPGLSGVLAAAGVLFALPAAMGRLPFDLPEAEQELMGGVSVEYGGPRLALLRWTQLVRSLVVTWLVAGAFLPMPLRPAAAVVATLVIACALYVLAAAASVLFARLRIDVARSGLLQVALLLGFALVFALFGS